MESYKLANSYDKTNDEMTRYWTDGKNVFFINSEIKKGDVESFVQHPSYIGYAKDKNNVYIKEKIRDLIKNNISENYWSNVWTEKLFYR